ncbi:MAG TPA: cbb3-type cytochrome c oxidase subunit I, partial [Methylophilaceae bacterium]|nr:cbb3-type cytochrome c oxidase subunit I [Methylophilaceae bacterium]
LFGGIYYILPRLIGREWPSANMIRAHFLLVGLGMVIYVVTLGGGGVMQGLRMLDPSLPFQASVEAAKPWLLTRSFAAVLISIGHVIFAAHALMLVLRGRSSVPEDPPFFFVRPVLVRNDGTTHQP